MKYLIPLGALLFIGCSSTPDAARMESLYQPGVRVSSGQLVVTGVAGSNDTEPRHLAYRDAIFSLAHYCGVSLELRQEFSSRANEKLDSHALQASVDLVGFVSLRESTLKVVDEWFDDSQDKRFVAVELTVPRNEFEAECDLAMEQQYRLFAQKQQIAIAEQTALIKRKELEQVRLQNNIHRAHRDRIPVTATGKSHIPIQDKDIIENVREEACDLALDKAAIKLSRVQNGDHVSYLRSEHKSPTATLQSEGHIRYVIQDRKVDVKKGAVHCEIVLAIR